MAVKIKTRRVEPGDARTLRAYYTINADHFRPWDPKRGYAISKAYQGKGLMENLCRHSIKYAFGELDLHRIMANYMPYNNRSAKLLKNLGFCREGYAKNYLKINGHWEDHVMMSLVRNA